MSIKSEFTLSTRLPFEEIIARLSDISDPSISASKAFWGVKNPNGKPFGGRINEEGFDIFKTYYRMNFHSPVLKGKFDRYPGRTEIHITAQLPKITMIAFALAVGIVLIPGLFIPYMASPFLFKVAGLLWLLWAFNAVIRKFRMECMAIEELLKHILEAQRLDD